MKREMMMPAEYAVMNEEEMTYTEGGSTYTDVLVTSATVVGAVVLGASYVWGIAASRSWLSVKSNREGNVFTVLGRATDAIGEDMTKSPANFLRDAVSTTVVVALAPLSAVLMLI